MKIALFRCCNTNVFLKQHEPASDLILRKLDVNAVDIKKFGCCGFPVRNINYKAYILASVRNLALAEEKGLNIITFCSCCYNSLKRANHLMKEDLELQKEINTTLEKEGLQYNGSIEVSHHLEFFYKHIGITEMKEKLTKSFHDLKIAAHYGCQLLRPGKILGFDNPLSPSIFDELIEITGAESIPWRAKLQCCGAPSWGIDDDLSMDLLWKKTSDARQSGADYICTAGPFCEIQFDQVQKVLLSKRDVKEFLPSILYIQLLGLCLGIDAKGLGIDKNELDISGVLEFLQ